jgi:hypothetical protein
MQSQHSRVCRSKVTSNRDLVAQFSGKCYMLGDLIASDDVSPVEMESILAVMFEQSLCVLGVQ